MSIDTDQERALRDFNSGTIISLCECPKILWDLKIIWTFPALALIKSDPTGGSLRASHQEQWDMNWSQGKIELEGKFIWEEFVEHLCLSKNVFSTGNESSESFNRLQEVISSSLYYLYSSLPSRVSIDEPFSGVSPGGLSRGTSGKDYYGHVFWDMVRKCWN